jgi:protein-S-isoprenylcysteine O-methyltransferase Ste14
VEYQVLKTMNDNILMRTTFVASLFTSVAVVALPLLIRLLTRGLLVVDLGDYRYFGLLPLLPGAWLALWCVIDFAVRGRGTPAPFDPPRKLVVKGPYRYVRNPMYIGMLLVLAGEAVLMSSMFVLLYTLLLWIASHLFVVFWEEPRLRRRFGERYEKYSEAVPRWLPRKPENN